MCRCMRVARDVGEDAVAYAPGCATGLVAKACYVDYVASLEMYVVPCVKNGCWTFGVSFDRPRNESLNDSLDNFTPRFCRNDGGDINTAQHNSTLRYYKYMALIHT